jgi:hypothetical protein
VVDLPASPNNRAYISTHEAMVKTVVNQPAQIQIISEPAQTMEVFMSDNSILSVIPGHRSRLMEQLNNQLQESLPLSRNSKEESKIDDHVNEAPLAVRAQCSWPGRIIYSLLFAQPIEK